MLVQMLEQHKATIKPTNLWSIPLMGAAGAVSAYCSWQLDHASSQMLLTWLLPFLWLMCSSRSQAVAVVASYYFVAWFDMPIAAHRITGWPQSLGLSALTLYVCAVALIWAVAWTGPLVPRCIRFIVLLAVTNMPPLAAFSAPSQLLSAGWLFPNLGLYGLILCIVSWPCIALIFLTNNKKIKTASIVVAVLLVATSITANVAWEDSQNAGNLVVKNLDTQLPRYPTSKSEHFNRQLELVNLASGALGSADSPNLVVLPESVGGVWQANIEWLWRSMTTEGTSPNKGLLVGFDIVESDDGAQSNGAILFEANSVSTVHARIPMPVGGWHPWKSAGHMPMRWFDSGLIKSNKGTTSLAVVFCYEELLLWPWVVTAWNAGHEKIQVVVLANQWFASHLNSNSAQINASTAQARLWGWPITRSVNFPSVVRESQTATTE
jgi:hypothetical protein